MRNRNTNDQANNKNHDVEQPLPAAQPPSGEQNGNNDKDDKTSTADENTDNESTIKSGLSSEERVLLRERKKNRLQAEKGHEAPMPMDPIPSEPIPIDPIPMDPMPIDASKGSEASQDDGGLSASDAEGSIDTSDGGVRRSRRRR